MIRFESEFYSKYNDHRFKVTFFQSNYNGIDTTVIGGTGSTFYLDKDWTDYLNYGQAIEIDGVDGFVSTFSYNAGLGRTEVNTTLTYSVSDVSFKNDIARAGSYAPIFNPKVNSLTTEWKGQQDEILTAIKSSYTDLVYLNRDEDSSVDWQDNEWFERFVEDWNLGNDRESKLIIYKWDGGVWDLQWAGRVVPDLLEWENYPSPRSYTFRVNDGFETLKDVPYDGDLNSLSNLKFIDVFKGVLSGLDLEQFWGASDPYIYESIEYQSTLVTGVNASDSPLDYTYVPENMFIERDTEDEVKFISQYDVLKACLEIFSARLSISNGAYRINQIRNFDTVSGYTARVFTKTNNTYAATSVPHKVVMDEVFAGGTFGYMEGLRRAYVAQETNQMALLPIAKGVLGDVWTTGGTTQYPNVSQSLGDLFADAGVGNSVEVSMDVYTSVIPNLAISNYFLDVAIEITTPAPANDWIKGNSQIPPYWGSGVVVADRWWGKRIYSGPNSQNIITKLKFKTPPIPRDMQNATLEIRFALGWSGGSLSSAAGVTWYTISNVNVSFPTNDNNLDTIFSVDNAYSAGNFTKDLELDKLIIKENTTVSSINTLLVDEDYNSGGGSLVASTLWDGDFDATDPLARVRVIEAMSLQFRPIEKYLGGFRGELFTYQTIDYNDKVYAMNGYRYDYSKDEYNGVWFEVATARAGLSGSGSGGGLSDKVPVGGGLDGLRIINVFETNRGLGTSLSVLDSGVSITSISIESAAEERIKEGDTIQLIDAGSQSVLQEFEVSDDVILGDTSISVDGVTLDNEILAGALIQHNPKEVVESNLMRSEVFNFKKNNKTFAHKEGLLAYDWGEESLRYGDSSKLLLLSPNQNKGDEVIDLTDTQNNYDIGRNTIIMFNPTGASIIKITGILPYKYIDGYKITIFNLSGDSTIQCNGEDENSVAGNRFAGFQTAISPLQGKSWTYSTYLNRWVLTF